MLEPQEIENLVRRIAERAQPERILVFGSYAKGTARATSDLDILVVRDTDLPMAQRAADLTPICAGYLVPIDLHVYTPEEVREYAKEEHSFLHTVLQTGWTVYDVSQSG
jgi:predicted nucleotidyltransferase